MFAVDLQYIILILYAHFVVDGETNCTNSVLLYYLRYCGRALQFDCFFSSQGQGPKEVLLMPGRGLYIIVVCCKYDISIYQSRFHSGASSDVTFAMFGAAVCSHNINMPTLGNIDNIML